MTSLNRIPTFFGSTTFPHLEKALGLFRPVGQNITQRVIISLVVGWLPLAVLVTVDSLHGVPSIFSFITDFGVHARSLIAVPLLILCEPLCLKRLEGIVTHFVHSGLVDEHDRPKFDRLLTSTQSLMSSTLAEVVAVVLSYLIALALVRYLPLMIVRPWYLLDPPNRTMSWAGWWYALVSMPLLLILVFGWFWRIVLWTRFLIAMSTIKLQLISAHPDRAAGLKFLNSELFAFMPLAFTFGVITAGSVANRVAYQGATIEHVQNPIIGLLLFVLLIFVGPLLIFVLVLHRQKVRGVFDYGQLAHEVGSQFEKKWLAEYEKFGNEALESPNFSATTDLYQIVTNVHEMSPLPFELRGLVSLIVATLLPFIPVIVMTMPIKQILQELVRLLV